MINKWFERAVTQIIGLTVMSKNSFLHSPFRVAPRRSPVTQLKDLRPELSNISTPAVIKPTTTDFASSV